MRSPRPARRLWRCLIGMLILHLAGAAWAQQSAVRSYPLPEHGTIEFKIPPSWKDEIQQVKGTVPPTITWSQASGEGFRALVTVGWQDDQPGDRMSIEEAKERVEASMAGLEWKPENDPKVQELRGSSAHGYYFSAADPEPRPGGFKYRTQGIALTGELIVAFVLFTSDGQQQIIYQALAAIGGAIHRAR